MKSQDLRTMAEDLSAKKNIPFKKTIHGKNKTELIKFIKRMNDDDGACDLHSLTKKELLERASVLPDFKKTFSVKTKAFLIEFINKNQEPDVAISPIHFDEIVDSPNHSKIQEAIERCFSDKSFDFNE